MEEEFMEIFDRFSLLVERKVIINNKVIPITIDDNGRKSKATLVKNSYEHYSIKAMIWDENIFIANGLYIYHIHEIIFAFLANQLAYDKIYYIAYDKYRSLIRFFYKKGGDQPILTINILNPKTKKVDISVDFTKVDCRIFLKILDYYLSRGEIDNVSESGVTCNYGHTSMKKEK